MRNYLFCILFPAACFLASAAYAGNDSQPVGARAAGLAGATVTLADVWAVNNNIAGIASLPASAIGVYYENRFGISAFNTSATAGVFSSGKYGGFGVEAVRFGDNLYNENRIGLGAAHKLGFVSLGIKASLLQTSIEGLGSRRTVAVDFGGQVDLIKELVFGAHIFNLNQAKMAEFNDERIPTVMKAGLSYRPYEKLMVNIETEKGLDHKADFKAGAEYLLEDIVFLRTGFSTLTQTVVGGIGIKYRGFQGDYALGNQSALGFSNHLSVSYQFK